MSSKFERCVEVVLKHEGGFANHPTDPGGATNFGISLRYARTQGSMLDLDKDGDVDVDDIKLVTKENAKTVYKEWFWRDVRGEELPSGVDLAVFDLAVNSGSGRAIRFLQRVVGVPQDGVIGPITMKAVKDAEPDVVISKLCDERIAFLRLLKTWPTFGRGWQNRIDDVMMKSMEFVGKPNMTVSEVVQTDTAKGAVSVATVGAIVGALAQAEPVIKALGVLSPWVAGAMIAAALVGVLIWRLKRA